MIDRKHSHHCDSLFIYDELVGFSFIFIRTVYQIFVTEKLFIDFNFTIILHNSYGGLKIDNHKLHTCTHNSNTKCVKNVMTS